MCGWFSGTRRARGKNDLSPGFSSARPPCLAEFPLTKTANLNWALHGGYAILSRSERQWRLFCTGLVCLELSPAMPLNLGNPIISQLTFEWNIAAARQLKRLQLKTSLSTFIYLFRPRTARSPGQPAAPSIIYGLKIYTLSSTRSFKSKARQCALLQHVFSCTHW